MSDRYERRRQRQRSLAAKRGWVTRRRRAAERERERERRSLAARRGWETRRREAQRQLDAEREREREQRAADRAAFDRQAEEFDAAGIDDIPADWSDEWEIAFEYEGTGYGGRHHAVDVNVRIRRDDGRPFGPAEAAAVLAQFQERLSRADRYPIPPGYEMAAIDWRRPKYASQGWRGGDDDPGPLVDFNAPMYVERDNPVAWDIHPSYRLGGIKE